MIQQNIKLVETLTNMQCQLNCDRNNNCQCNAV